MFAIAIRPIGLRCSWRNFATGAADQEYGERTSSVIDAAGNHWYIATFKGEDYKSRRRSHDSAVHASSARRTRYQLS